MFSRDSGPNLIKPPTSKFFYCWSSSSFVLNVSSKCHSLESYKR
ncbi:hypothetical protein Taro_000094 [Colocasia esculenta]|uniref:Uncharacterized protein n=1 Tax=Colocasia esculenta TaxID=4460 RepID=A0A843TGK6_COLES|nr:hypothetical protein [Colocasia esculenta]